MNLYGVGKVHLIEAEKGESAQILKEWIFIIPGQARIDIRGGIRKWVRD